jgi:hypothetical protein
MPNVAAKAKIEPVARAEEDCREVAIALAVAVPVRP